MPSSKSRKVRQSAAHRKEEEDSLRVSVKFGEALTSKIYTTQNISKPKKKGLLGG